MKILIRITICLLALLFFCSCTVQPVARIELAYDSRPVGETTPFEPLITFTDSDSGQRVNPDVRNEKGWLLLNELPPGRYRITIDIDANMQNPSLFPGDLFFEGYINVDKCDTCGSSTLHYDLQRIIHLTSPGDNSGRVHIWGVNCGLEHAPFASPVVFSLEPIAENVDYNYTVYRMSLGPDHSWDMTTNGQTKETTIRHDSELKQQVEIARSALAAANASVERVEGDAVRAQAVLNQVKIDHQRIQKLFASKSISANEIDKSAQALEVAEADLAKSKASVMEARKNLIVAQNTLD